MCQYVIGDVLYRDTFFINLYEQDIRKERIFLSGTSLRWKNTIVTFTIFYYFSPAFMNVRLSHFTHNDIFSSEIMQAGKEEASAHGKREEF